MSLSTEIFARGTWEDRLTKNDIYLSEKNLRLSLTRIPFRRWNKYERILKLMPVGGMLQWVDVTERFIKE